MPQSQDVEPAKFPTQQLRQKQNNIAICRFSEPIAFTSIMAYTYEMVKDLGIDEGQAPFYAGLVVSAYAVAETLTSMGWGALSDRVGRKPIVLSGLVGVGLSSLTFGLATNYWVAFAARLVGGALNGNVSVMQTMVAEMVKNPEHEPRAYAVNPFVWTLGSIIGTAMGGFLAKPAHFYPSIFPEDGLFGRYPYLLPNLVSVAVVAIAVIQGIFFLEETHHPGKYDKVPDSNDEAVDEDDEIVDENTPLRGAERPRKTRTSFSDNPYLVESSLPLPVDERIVDLRRSSFGTVHSIRPVVAPAEVTATPASESSESAEKEKTFNPTVIMLVVLVTIFSYHQMAAGSLFPTYLLDLPKQPRGTLDLMGGLGYDVHDVGTFLSINGIVALFVQAVIFPIYVENTGIWFSLVSVVLLYPLSYVFIPFLSMLSTPAADAGIYASLTLQAFCGIVIFPTALILLKDATPSPSGLGKVNGLAMSGACLARTISSPIAGIIYSASGSGAAWFSCVAVAVVGIIQLAWLRGGKFKVNKVVVDNPISGHGAESEDNGRAV
ncbi:hypothetical protein PspLS_05138 [Pyricularia sp. CBS 133598]|nr:hypothetical protein PspLS_05138 [Pyricularia sp. CBS 133598]